MLRGISRNLTNTEGKKFPWMVDALFGSLPGQVDVARASGGGYVGTDGLWRVVGTNVARYDANPTTFHPRGLLSEGQRTNLLLWNRDLTNAAWTKTNMTASKIATGIDGAANSASRLTATSNNGTVLQAVTSGSAARATTAYVRRVSGSGTIEMTQNGGTNWASVTVGAGWTRVGPTSATITNPSVGFRLGTSGDVIEVDYVQLESATFPSSAIATTTASATRASETILMSNLAAMGYNAQQGTLYMEAEFQGLLAGANQTICRIDNDTITEVLRISKSSVTGTLMADVVVGGTTVASLNSGLFPAIGSIYRMAFAFAENDFAFSVNGGAVSTDTSGGMPSPTRFVLASGAVPFFGWIRKLGYYPSRLSDGQLQALTQ